MKDWERHVHGWGYLGQGNPPSPIPPTLAAMIRLGSKGYQITRKGFTMADGVVVTIHLNQVFSWMELSKESSNEVCKVMNFIAHHFGWEFKNGTRYPTRDGHRCIYTFKE